MRRNYYQGKRLESGKTLASNFQTSVIDFFTVDSARVQIDCNNVTDNTGTFTVQTRAWVNDNIQGEWVDETGSGTPTLSNADENFVLYFNFKTPCQVRISFVAAGGTPDGDCDIYLSGAQN